jgi:hypothetical protein
LVVASFECFIEYLAITTNKEEVMDKPQLFIKCKCGEFLNQICRDCGRGFIEITVDPCFWCLKVAKEEQEKEE